MLKTWEFSQNSPIIPGVWAELVNFSRTERTKTHGISFGVVSYKIALRFGAPKLLIQIRFVVRLFCRVVIFFWFFGTIEVIELPSMVAIHGEKLGRWNPMKTTCFRLSDKQGAEVEAWVFEVTFYIMAFCDKIFRAEGFFEDEDQRILGFTMRFVGCEHLSDTLPEAIFLPLKISRAPKGKE